MRGFVLAEISVQHQYLRASFPTPLRGLALARVIAFVYMLIIDTTVKNIVEVGVACITKYVPSSTPGRW